MHTTPCPMRMRDVRAATHVRHTSGALMCAYQRRACSSPATTRSKPISSAYTACSTHPWSTSRSCSADGSAIWASKIIENCTPTSELAANLDLCSIEIHPNRSTLRVSRPVDDLVQHVREQVLEPVQGHVERRPRERLGPGRVAHVDGLDDRPVRLAHGRAVAAGGERDPQPVLVERQEPARDQVDDAVARRLTDAGVEL